MLLHKHCRNSEPIDVRWHIRRTLLVAAGPTPPPPTAVSNSVPLFATILSDYKTTPSSKFDATLVLKGTYVLILPSESLITSSRSSLFLWTSLACLVALLVFCYRFLVWAPSPCLPAPIASKLCALVSNKYFWPAAAQLWSQSLHLGLLSVRPLWHSRRSRRREALYARVQSRGAISSGGIYKAATVYAQGCTACLLSHFPLAPFHCPLTCDAADISGRLVNLSSDSGWEGRGG